VPGLGTRPGIRQEWDELLCWAASNGLNLLEYKARALPYVSPLFERNALRSVGIEGYPADWRHGDLAIFEVDGVAGASTVPGKIEPRWREVQFGRVRIRVRKQAFAGWRSPQLRTVVSGGILPSVSRRDSRLKFIAVWTSGNRAFGCDGCFAFWKIAEALSFARCPVSELSMTIGADLNEAQKEEVRNTVSQLVEVIAVEEQEIQDWRTEGNENVVELPAHQG
jgi:hypothetical protein